MNNEFLPYGNGWNSKSGKKRLNSIKMPAVITIQTVAITGAVDRYFKKYFMKDSPRGK
jgi:hypothetical protein